MATVTQSRPLRRGSMKHEGALYDLLFNMKEIITPRSTQPVTRAGGIRAQRYDDEQGFWRLGSGDLRSRRVQDRDARYDAHRGRSHGLVGSAADVDIIGNTGGAANCH